MESSNEMDAQHWNSGYRVLLLKCVQTMQSRPTQVGISLKQYVSCCSRATSTLHRQRGSAVRSREMYVHTDQPCTNVSENACTRLVLDTLEGTCRPEKK